MREILPSAQERACSFVEKVAMIPPETVATRQTLDLMLHEIRHLVIEPLPVYHQVNMNFLQSDGDFCCQNK